MLETKRKSPIVNNITCNELMLLYKMTKRGAENRINNIRRSLDKTPQQKLTVIDFCKYEGISVQDFDILLERSYS